MNRTYIFPALRKLMVYKETVLKNCSTNKLITIIINAMKKKVPGL